MSDTQKSSLLDMVSYQDGAVVSRTLIDKKTGRSPCSPSAKGRA